MNTKNLWMGAVGALVGGCGGDTKQLSELEEIRVPVVQVLVPQGASGGAIPSHRCRTEGDGATWCQQYPLPTTATQGVLRFVAISPYDNKPTVAIQRVERVLPNNDGVPVDKAPWGLEPVAGLTLQETNGKIRVWSQAFTLKVPPAMATGGVFSFYYEAADGTHTPDTGVFTVVVQPPQGLVTNIPPRITAVSPTAKTTVGDTTDLTATLEAQTGAKSRVQWYVTSGQLSNEGAKATQWKKVGTGPQGAFVVVRDLAGGSDYAHTWVER